MLMIFVKVVADAEASNLCAVKYDNAMYTTKLPELAEDEEVDVDEVFEENEDNIDYEFADLEAREFKHILKLARKYNKL